jgi:YVTN family beta-propeller protein
MLRPALWRAWAILGLLGYVLLVLALSAIGGYFARTEVAHGQALAVFDRPTTSSPIALSADNTLLWVVNPDDDSVSVINTATNTVLRKISVGDEPQSVAVDPNNTFAYVANAASNNVTVIRITSPSPAAFVAAPDLTVGVRGSITTGAEPWNIVVSPDGLRVFVANSGQDTITVINAQNRTVIGSVNLRSSVCNGATPVEQARHFQPRGLAVTLDSAQLYVTRFISFTRAGGVQGSDTGKEGLVCRLNINTASTAISGYQPVSAIPLAPTVTGFNIDSNGDGTPDATSAYPNQLQSIVIRGGQAYLPNIASSPSRPLRFNVDTHAYVNRISGIGGAEADAGAINLHLGARVAEAGKPRLFFANPWAIGFPTESGAGAAYAVSAGSDLLVKLNVDAAGELSFTGGVSTTSYIDLNDPDDAATSGANAGKNPLGIAISGDGATAYVMNYVSRNVSVVDLASDSVTAVIPTTELPPAGTLDEIIQVGKEIFFSSRGLFDRPDGTTVSTRDRLSSEGWQNCASCHFGGLTDGTIWQFGSGPRKSVPMNGTWDPRNPDDQRILNYSAIFDEVQDFEANIRNVSGPGNLPNTNPPQLDPNHGLIFGATINDAPAAVPPLLNIANAGRPQHTVTLPGGGRGSIPALDAMKEWVRFAIRTPNGPLTTQEITAGGGSGTGANQGNIDDGRIIFSQAGCQTCHGGGKWTNSTKDFTSPALAADVFTEADGNGATAPNPNGGQYLARFLRDVGSFNLNVSGQANQIGGQPAIGAVEIDTAGRDALGLDYDGNGQGAGFNPPSLLGIFALQPYYHNGACETLACVVADEDHRRAGLRPGASDPLNDAGNRLLLVSFLESLDAQTTPATNLRVRSHDIFFDPPTVIVGSQVDVGVNISLFGPGVPTFTPGPLKVTFYDGRPGDPGTTVIGEADLAGIEEDFSEVTVKVPWQVPAETGRRRIFVTVDSSDLFAESSERDNTANRKVLVVPVPPDRTPPVVSDVRINDGDAIATSTAATVTFNASDPASPGGAETSGPRSFCLVRYTFNSAERRWVEEVCGSFTLLPAANGDGSFTVNATLRPRAGTAYVFVWVKDGAGNISRTPGFDVISFVPDQRIELDRNEVRVFRITLAPGQSVSFTATPSTGDIDLSAFNGVGSGATRIAVSAQNGLAPETVSLSVPGGGATTTFQVEVRAVVNSAFTLAVTEGVALLAQAEVIDPGKDVDERPIVAGPPALQAAIGEAQDTSLPMLRR